MKQMISLSLSSTYINSMTSKSRFTMTWFRCWMMSTRSTSNWKLSTSSWKLHRQRWMLFKRVYKKKMKKKNVIIHHLKATSSQLSTSISKDRFSKSIKLSDLSLFEDSRQNMNNWLSWMQNKLKMNKNHFSIKEMKITYVKSRVSETMIKHIALKMRNMITNSFLEAEEILSIINKMYDDFNQHHMTQRQFLKLY